ncbi:MAG: cell division protein FtsZ [bacterium]|nr:cell division protein FtsZ [bacterium]MDD5354015.1 cell division protein FtsZ [bacterium]MDD5755916.1 cell division protein FtsZ [bacterium]
MSSLKFRETFAQSANIKVIGVGGGGGNAVNRMVMANIKGVDFIAANTDAQALKYSLATQRLQLGEKATRGLGVGGDPAIGKKAAEESKALIKETLRGADMVFVTAGLGGGTGTGGAPVVADIAKSIGALTVAVVTKPFMFEGKVRAKQAEEGLNELRSKVDTLLVIPNQKLFSVIDKNTSLLDTFKKVDEVLQRAVQSISDIITQHGVVNVDFADVRTIMQSSGNALMGAGMANGQNRARIAAEKAVTSPLLEDVSINGANKVLVNITGGLNLTMYETEQIMTVMHNYISSDANVIFGAVFDDKLQEELKVTVIATGFSAHKETARHHYMQGFTQEKQRPLPLEEDEDPSVPEPREKVYSKVDINVPAFIRKQKGIREESESEA